MSQRITHPPTKPALVVRHAMLVTVLSVLGYLLWVIVARTSAQTPWPQPAPGPQVRTLLALVVGVAWAVTVIAGIVRHAHWRAAMEAQKVYESIARVLRLPLEERARMKVRARDGLVPSDVRVRVNSVTDARAERTRTNLAAAFADAIGEPVERVRVADEKRGVRVWVEQPVERHEPEGVELEDADEPAIAPVPARPTDNRTQERVTAAMRGALNDKGVEVTVTDTHASGAPQEVWVEYPPALTSSIESALLSVRNTMERVHHARNDEWAVRWVSARDRIILTDRVDPLARIVDLPDARADVDLHKGVQVGITESGSPWLIPLMGGNHTLIAGASGSGKGSVLWNVLRGVAPLVHDGRARIWLIDPKGGMELGPAEHVAHRFAITPEQAEKMLADLREIMQGKAERLRREGRRKIEVPTQDEPLDLVVVDELANATSLGGKAGAAVGDHIAALCSMGRAPAVTVIGAVQDPRKETFKHRGLFTQAVALRMSEANETNLILGQGARAQGALADMIPKAHPGIGYVIRDGLAGHERVRAAYVSDAEIEATAKRMERPLPPPPIGQPVTAAAQDQLGVTEPRQAAISRNRDTVRIVALNTLPVRAHFDGDPDACTITAWENSPDGDDLIRVTYRYDGEVEKVTDVDDTETVRLAT